MKAIIFDCDGTLVDSEMSHFTAWKEALKKHDYPLTVEDYYKFVGSPTNKTSEVLAELIGKNCADELLNDKHHYFRSLIERNVPSIKATVAFLHRLVNQQNTFNYKLAVASGAPREEILIYLTNLKIDHLFDVIVSGQDDLHHYNDPEGVNKPKPYIYIETAKQLGLEPFDCVAIEDSHTGVLSASSAGCLTIAVPQLFSLNHDFTAADLIIPTFENYEVEGFLKELESYFLQNKRLNNRLRG